LMARSTPPPQPPALTPERITQGIERLRRRIEELEKFDPKSVKRRWAPETKALEVAIQETLARIFGHNTPNYRRYQGAAQLDHGGLSISNGPEPLYKVHEWLAQGKADALALLSQAVRSLEEDLAESSTGAGVAPSAEGTTHALNDEIFVVHGHDDAAKTEVARCIERAGLKAVILHEQPNEGKTIIEKFEKHGATVGFAVIIATPDDFGGTSTTAF
jgi:hypothetical protein